MLSEPTILASATHLLARSLRKEYDIDPEPVFAQAGIAYEETLMPQMRYSLSTMRALWRAAIQASGDPTIGLKTGWYAKPEYFHAFGFSWLASSTLLGALQRFCRFHKVLSTASRILTLEETHDAYRLSRKFPDGSQVPPKEGIDAGMTALLKLCQIIADEDVRPLRVDFVRDESAHPDAYRSHLGAPINFGSEVDAFYFDKARLEAPLPGGTPDVARATDRVAEQYLDTLDPFKTASEVRRLLLSLLPSGNFDQQSVARRLHRSTSTLHRQLQEEGATFREILDSTRHTLAEDYLRQGRYSHAEIAFLLGYSDQSNFSRAFKRWAGMTPREFEITAA